jgi:hypothetical protein
VPEKPEKKSPGKKPRAAAPKPRKPTASPGRSAGEARPARAPRARRPAAAAPAAVAAALPDLARAAEPPVLGHIPWVYGDTRVTAMARDPHWLFAYWEVPDDAIDRARAAVGDAHGWCVLRVYDTTHRLFDGTNANWYTDVAVMREANNHYVLVSRPGATLHVEIGIKSHEGWFAAMARSGPVEMPRDGIARDARADWMTVTSDAPAREYVHRVVRRPDGAHPLEARPDGGVDTDVAGVLQAFVGEGWSRTEWREADMDGRVVRWIKWAGTVEVLLQGERTVVRTAWGERVILGPWMVTITGNAVSGRRVLDRWTVHYSWTTEGGRARVETAEIIGRILGWSWAAGARQGSEARLAGGLGASEILARGASEWRWLGGSERWLGGASESLFAGASEARYLGASEMLGASERLFLGASGWFGGSEALAAGGGRESRLAGEALGGSESQPGAPGAPSAERR